MATLEFLSVSPNKITPSKAPTEAVCLLQWTGKDGSVCTGTGFLAVDQHSPRKQVYWMSAGHNFQKLNIVNPTLSEEETITLKDYFIKVVKANFNKYG